MRRRPERAGPPRLPRTAGALLCATLGAAALTACNGTATNAVPTTIVAVPPGCDTSRVVIIGASIDLSGPGAVVGRASLTGLEMGIAKVNGANGIPPRNSCFELAYKDNRGDPAVDTKALLDLVNVEKAAVVVGTFLSASTATYLGSLGVTALSLSALPATSRPGAWPYTFPMTASMDAQATVIGRALRSAAAPQLRFVYPFRLLLPVGVVVTADAASRQGADHLAASAGADDFRIVARAVVAPSGRDAARALRAVRSARPDVVVVLDDAGAVSSVLAARAAIGWSVPVIASTDATTVAVAHRVAVTRGVSVVVPVGASVGPGGGSSAARSFRNQLLARLHTARLTGSIIPYAQTYDAMTMLGNAANGSMGIVPAYVQSFLQNANFRGLLASYTYTAGAHTGVSAAQETVVALNLLSNGFFRTRSHPVPTS